jgi:uncharacterized membrane protein
MEVRRLSELGWLLIGLALLIYDEIITAARYGYCYPYPVFGCIGDVYVASAIPFTMVLIGAFLLRYEGSYRKR